MNAIKTKPLMEQAAAETYPLNTEQFANNNRVKPGTVRHRFCLTGSYFGVKPKKLLNGRLAWPDVQVTA